MLFCAATLTANVFAAECTFDQTRIASELSRIAARNPGGQGLAGESALEWHEANGQIVKLSYGGCEDLLAGISVRFSDNQRTPGIDELFAALTRYWSVEYAQAIRAALRSDALVRRTVDGVTRLEASGAVATDFPLGFVIQLGAHQVSVVWQIA